MFFSHSHVALCVGFLVSEYRIYWWEITEIFRKLLMNVIPVMLAERSAAQLLLVLLVTVAYLGVTAWVKPFKQSSDNALQLVSLGTLLCVLVSTLLGKLTDTSSVAADDNRDFVLGIVQVCLALGALSVELSFAGVDVFKTLRDSALVRSVSRWCVNPLRERRFTAARRRMEEVAVGIRRQSQAAAAADDGSLEYVSVSAPLSAVLPARLARYDFVAVVSL